MFCATKRCSSLPGTLAKIRLVEKLTYVRAIVHPDERAAFDARLQAFLEAGTEYRSQYPSIRLDSSIRGETVTRFQNRYRCKNGEYRWFSWNSIPSGKPFTPVGLAKKVRAVLDGKK